MTYSDEHLNHYGERFTTMGLARTGLTFDRYLTNPRHYEGLLVTALRAAPVLKRGLPALSGCCPEGGANLLPFVSGGRP